MKHSWLVEFIHKLTWNPKKWEAANPPPLPAEKLERLVSMYPPDPPRPRYDEVRAFFAPTVMDFMARLQGWLKRPGHEMTRFRVVLQLRRGTPGCQGFEEPITVSIGTPRLLLRDVAEGHARLEVHGEFEARERLVVDGVVLIDEDRRAVTRGFAFFRGGSQVMHDGDTLKVFHEVGAHDEGNGIALGRLVRAEGEEAAPRAA
jgi:hypothetical protein